VVEEAAVELRSAFPHRGTARGTRACVAADHPLAVSAGLLALAEGGTAADAAVAMGAVMAVVQPHYSHLGGDAFALTHDGATRRIEALNSSGPAPLGLDIDEYRRIGDVPDTGPLAVTVPGCVDGWGKLHARAGRLPWKRLLEPASTLAREGFPASRGLARAMGEGRRRLYPADYFKRTFGAVAGDGGQRVVQPELARTLEALAEGGPGAFYEGELRDACIAHLNGRGARFSEEDWRPPGEWREAISAPFAGHLVYTQPPVSQGFVLPLALRVYERLLGRAPGRFADPLLQYSAVLRAFEARVRRAGEGFDPSALLSGESIEALAAESLRVAETPEVPARGDTTYILAIDAEGNAVSLIQSVFAPWGSGVVVPGTGILLNNRMRGFNLRPGHPNELAPGRRPMHTLHSYMATEQPADLLPLARKLGEAAPPPPLRLVGGTPGAHRQVQTNLQVLDTVLRHGADLQDALDAPRWSIAGGGPGGPGVEVETRTPDVLGGTFRSAGLAVQAFAGWDGRMGRAYIARTRLGWVEAAADLRGDGHVAVL
jgi:gamma-glutamyltranspeptidase/glutathione hydrolase